MLPWQKRLFTWVSLLLVLSDASQTLWSYWSKGDVKDTLRHWITGDSPEGRVAYLAMQIEDQDRDSFPPWEHFKSATPHGTSITLTYTFIVSLQKVLKPNAPLPPAGSSKGRALACSLLSKDDTPLTTVSTLYLSPKGKQIAFSTFSARRCSSTSQSKSPPALAPTLQVTPGIRDPLTGIPLTAR
jgi:hypothetical protein